MANIISFDEFKTDYKGQRVLEACKDLYCDEQECHVMLMVAYAGYRREMENPNFHKEPHLSYEKWADSEEAKKFFADLFMKGKSQSQMTYAMKQKYKDYLEGHYK